jgi:flagellar biosynthesis protein FliQ
MVRADPCPDETTDDGVALEMDMNSDTALALTSELLKQGLVLSLPLLAVILLVGLLISVIQVVTQVQDPSISFVPKLVCFVVMLALLAPWMLHRLTAFGVAMFARLVP